MLEDHDDLDPILHEDHTLGRTLTYFICTGMVMLSVISAIRALISYGTDEILVFLIGLVITLIFAYGILIGSRVARWIWSGLAGLTGAGMLVVLGPMFANSRIYGVVLLLSAIFHIGSAVLLTAPSPVSRYLKHRRALRTS